MGWLPLLSTMRDDKKFNLFPEYVWMIFVGMLLVLLLLTNVFPAKAWTEDEDYVIIDDWLNNRLIKVTSDDDGNVFHPGVPTVKAVSEFVNGLWSPLPVNNYLPNNFSVNGNLVSCVLAPPSSWADDDHYRVIQPSSNAIYSIGIPAISVLEDDYYAYFQGGDGLIYVVVSDKPIYLKNKDSRGSFGVYSILPDPEASSTVIYQWTGSWNRFGYTSFSDTSVSDRIAISTLFYGKLYWEDFEYTETVLGVPVTRKTDNYALYNGTLPRLDILSSSFDAPEDIPVDPAPSTEYVLVQFNGYWLFDFEGSGIAEPVVVPVSSYLQELQTQYSSTDNVAKYSTDFFGLDNTNSRYFWAFYLNYSSLDSVKVYYSWDLPSDLDAFRSTVTPTSLTIVNKDDGNSAFSQVYLNDYTYYILGTNSNVPGTLYLSLQYRYNGSVTYSLVSMSDKIAASYNQGVQSSKDFRYPFLSSFGLYKLGLEYRIGFDSYINPYVSPTPEPTATPEPTPSATPIPSPGGTIYVVTPVPPTSPIGFQPYDPGSVEFPALGVHQFENITDQLPDRVNNTTAAASLGFLGFLMGFLPAEALWFLWFLLFILVVLAIVRLFIHFTGG